MMRLSQVRVGLVVVAGLLSGLLLPGTADAEDKTFGAIAYAESRHIGAFGFGNSLAGATDAAVRNCSAKGGLHGCVAHLWFADSYGALAEASSGEFGTGWGTTLGEAEQYALERCQNEGGSDCAVTLTDRTTRISEELGRGGIPTKPELDLSPPQVRPDDVKRALECGLSAAQRKIPDQDLRHAIDTVLTGRNMAAVRDNLQEMFIELGIGLTPFGECARPFFDPPKVGG